MCAAEAAAITEAEAERLFAELRTCPGLLVAVSGGPDSTALLFMLARWRKALTTGPRLYAATVDHGLRAESGREARAVGSEARQLGIPHQVILWPGDKPRSRVQQRARTARYALLAKEAERVGARDVVTAHTLEDQAETVLLRLAAGTGVAGLAAMAPVTRLPSGLRLLRPLLSLPKARLVATCQEAGRAFAEDPSNANPEFARPRLRAATGVLAREGLTAVRLARLAKRAQRAEAALAWATDEAMAAIGPTGAGQGATRIPLELWRQWPDEIAFRVLRRTVSAYGVEGTVEQGKLERLLTFLGEATAKREEADPGRRPWKRTLAGALVTLARNEIVIARAPARREGRHPPAGAFTSSDEVAAASLGIS